MMMMIMVMTKKIEMMTKTIGSTILMTSSEEPLVVAQNNKALHALPTLIMISMMMMMMMMMIMCIRNDDDDDSDTDTNDDDSGRTWDNCHFLGLGGFFGPILEGKSKKE